MRTRSEIINSGSYQFTRAHVSSGRESAAIPKHKDKCCISKTVGNNTSYSPGAELPTKIHSSEEHGPIRHICNNTVLVHRDSAHEGTGVRTRRFTLKHLKKLYTVPRKSFRRPSSSTSELREITMQI